MKIDFDYVRRVGRNVRVHGNGFVQIDLEDRPGERVHLFGHPAIPRQVRPTPIHDHRFGFVSTILSGCLVNVMWEARPAGSAATHVVCTWEAPAPGREDTKLDLTDERVLIVKRYVDVLETGYRYVVPPGALHETFANEPTLTHMVKDSVFDIRPRVLCRIGQDPDNSFDRHAVLSETHLWEIVEDAFRNGWLLS